MESEIPRFLELLFMAGGYIGIGYVLSIPMVIIESIHEIILHNRKKRKQLKFLSNDDMNILIDYLNGNYSEYDIGKVIKNAYVKDREIKRIRKNSRKNY